MKFKTFSSAIAISIMAVSLAACDKQGVNSTPAPTPGTPTPAPTPTPTPTPGGGGGSGDSPAAALGYTSDTTFESATSFFAVRPPNTVYGDQEAEPFGEGTEIEFSADSDSYTFTRSDSTTVTVTPNDIDADGDLQGEGGLWGSSEGTVYVVEDGAITHTVAMVPPGAYDDITMNHMAISLWNIQDSSAQVPTNEIQWQIWGNRTETMPTSGSATYSIAAVGANGFDPNADSIPALPGNEGAAYDFFNGQSTGELGVDFASGDINLMLHLIGHDYVADTDKDFGEFIGTGDITSGAAYGGTFAAGGEFYGAFFGPNAEETGFTFFIDSGDLKATGIGIGFQD